MRLGRHRAARRDLLARAAARHLEAAGGRDRPPAPRSCSTRFKLIAKRDDFAGSLSGGQRKLLEMARALMVQPEMIMLDEPMAGVNPALTQSLLGHVKRLRDEGMTVLFVEHDMDMVRDISDWVIVMAEGRVIAEGTPDTVMADPRGDRRLPRRAPRRRATSATTSCMQTRRGRRRSWSMPRTSAEDDRTDDDGARGAGMTIRPGRPADRRGAPGTRRRAVVEADDIVAGYLPGVNILNGCSLVAYPGEMIGIIGPNGAGKSTLLKAHVRPGQRALRHGDPARRGHHQPQGATGWWRWASASCRRPTTSSRR